MAQRTASPYILSMMLAGAIGFPLAFSPTVAASLGAKKDLVSQAAGSLFSEEHGARAKNEPTEGELAQILERKRNAEDELSAIGLLEKNMLSEAGSSAAASVAAASSYASAPTTSQISGSSSQAALSKNAKSSVAAEQTMALLDGALKAANALEKRQQKLMERTGKLKEELRRLDSPTRAMLGRQDADTPEAEKPVRVETAKTAPQPSSMPVEMAAVASKQSKLEENSVDLLRRQREVLVDEVIRLRHQIKNGNPSAKSQVAPDEGSSKLMAEYRQLQAAMVAERSRADELEVELEKLRTEKQPGTPDSALESELRESLAYQQERADRLEQQYNWVSDQMKALRRYAVERRQVQHKMMQQEAEAGDLKVKLMAMDNVDDENDQLRRALRDQQQQLSSVQSAAQQFLQDKNGDVRDDEETAAEAGKDTTPASGTVITVRPQGVDSSKRLEAVIKKSKEGPGKKDVPMYVGRPDQLSFQ